MTVNRSNLMLTCVAMAAALVGTSVRTLAQERTSEAHIRDLIQQAAQIVASGQVGAPTTAQQGGQTTPPAAGPKVPLTLDDAVKLALDRNLDIVVQRLNPEVNDLAVASARAVFFPSLTSTLASQGTTQTPATQISLGTNNSAPVTDLVTYNGGIAQTLSKGGGSFQVALNNSRQTSTSNIANYNPQFSTAWSGTFTQPLLRNFRIDANRQSLQVARINRDISDVQLRSTISNTLSNVRNAYWDYVFAIQSVDVARQSVDLGNNLVRDNQTRVQVGTMAPIDVVTARAQAATAVQNLVAAQATMRTAELALKRLIVGGTQDPNWNATLDPVDRPDFRVEAIDIPAAVRSALSQRTDIAIAAKDVEMNDVTLRYLNDQTKPQADLVATYGLQGIGGDLYQRNNSVLGSTPTIIPGSIVDAYSSLFRNLYPRWTVQANISVPLGLSTQQASVARARVQLSQVQAQLKQIELQVATEVTNAAVTVTSDAERVQAAQVARDLAQQQLDAENSKFAVGMSTNYFVVQAQNQLATAQNNELQAVLNYRKALVELDRLQQTTLQSLNITVVGATGR
jgi:outer membrane protein